MTEAPLRPGRPHQPSGEQGTGHHEDHRSRSAACAAPFRRRAGPAHRPRRDRPAAAAPSTTPRPTTCWRPRWPRRRRGSARSSARWRAAGCAASGSFGPGPAWCWLTPAGMAATGRRVARPAARAGAPGAHPRGAGRPAVAAGRPRLRRGAAVVALRAAHPRRPPQPVPAPRTSRTPRSTGRTAAARPHAGQVWAVEVELTAKTAARTARIMAGLLSGPPRYAQVVYLTSPAARHVVAAAAGNLPPAQAGRVAVRDLPPAALAARGRDMAGLLRTLALLWLLRQAFRLLRTLLIAAILAALWPVTRPRPLPRPRRGRSAGPRPACTGPPPGPAGRWPCARSPPRCATAPGGPSRWPRCGTGSRPPACWRTAGCCPAVLLTAPLAVPAGLAAGGPVVGSGGPPPSRPAPPAGTPSPPPRSTPGSGAGRPAPRAACSPPPARSRW